MQLNLQNTDEEDEKSVKEQNKRESSDEMFDSVESLLTGEMKKALSRVRPIPSKI